jgi:CO/xanthine dehydrogenase FAD-binding subunit
MIGHIPSPDLVAGIAMNAARNEIEPTGDIHATADYKRHLAFVLGKRAIQQAVSRAREGWGL